MLVCARYLKVIGARIIDYCGRLQTYVECQTYCWAILLVESRATLFNSFCGCLNWSLCFKIPKRFKRPFFLSYFQFKLSNLWSDSFWKVNCDKIIFSSSIYKQIHGCELLATDRITEHEKSVAPDKFFKVCQNGAVLVTCKSLHETVDVDNPFSLVTWQQKHYDKNEKNLTK